jgi:hypothetical protein
MWKTARVLAVWSVLSVVQYAWGTPVCWTSAEGGNGHGYELARLPGPDLGWESARIAAESATHNGVNGHLATVSSAAENAFLLNLLAQAPEVFYVWLGGHQSNSSAPPSEGWTWITGEPWIYTRWAAGEPNDYAGVPESYLAMWGVNSGREPGAWNDEGYNIAKGGISSNSTYHPLLLR